MKKNKNFKKIIIWMAVASFLSGGSFLAFAQTTPPESAQAPSTVSEVEVHRQALLKELEAIEKEISNYNGLINEKKSEASSLQRDISILDAKISKIKLQIKAIDLQIATLRGRIADKEKNIDTIENRVDREKLSLAESIRTMHAYGDTSVIEVMLAYDTVSDYLSEVDSLDVLQESLQESFKDLRDIKQQEEVARDDLVDKKTDAAKLRELQESERKQLAATEAERRRLLNITKGKESEYKKIVSEKQKDAAAIRTALFKLQGTAAITFEKAVLYAERASAHTGVRPAFILGIIAQESDLGKNVGQCNLPDDPPKYQWQAIMKPSRDHAPYLDITSRLGLDPRAMPLSCPLSVGYGGAMGPAQFIPSTWIQMESKIAAATGHNPPNPWHPEDAFMASALYLADLGASSRAGEFEAAARYYAGGNWTSSHGRSYANQVLAKVENYQEQIDIIKSVAIR